MKNRIVAVAATALALALPAAAQAALPKTGETLIVPAKSLGGIALGANAKKVTKTWGKNPDCEYQCLYQAGAASGETPALGSVLLEAKSTTATAKVWMVFIEVGERSVGSTQKPNFKTPLTRFKTAKGIGLGSTAAELKRAYHAVKKTRVSSEVSYYTLKGPKQSATSFTTGASGRITAITVETHPGG